jgi:T5SS/PEP-CTERM-associated repeat protein
MAMHFGFRSRHLGVPGLRRKLIAAIALIAVPVSITYAAIDVTPTAGVTINNIQPLLPSPGNITLNATDSVVLGPSSTLTVNSGSVLFAGTLNSTAATVSSNLLLTGNGSRITLRRADNGRGGQLGSGNWQVLDGGVFDAGDPASCTTTTLSCSMIIGAAPGATSTLLVSGGGSLFQSIDFFTIGQNNGQLSILGGDVNATVTVANGGRIESEDLVVGAGVLNDPTGARFARATVDVQGTGSVWNAATLTTAVGLRTVSTLNISNGGVLNVSGLASLTNGNGSTSMTVSGTGSRVTSGSMNVGQGGDATVQVNTGAALAVTGQWQVPAAP